MNGALEIGRQGMLYTRVMNALEREDWISPAQYLARAMDSLAKNVSSQSQPHPSIAEFQAFYPADLRFWRPLSLTRLGDFLQPLHE